MDVSAFATLVGVVLAFGAAVWTTILSVPETIRGVCLNRTLWSQQAFPQTIRDIEEQPNWRAPVRIYYIEAESYNGSVFLWLILGLLFVFFTFAVCVASDHLKAVHLEHGISALSISQAIVLLFSLLWVTGLFLVNVRSRRRLAKIAVGDYGF
jgi:hypothetical protein